MGNIEVLIVTMNRKSTEFVEKMNIPENIDIIVANQADAFNYSEQYIKSSRIRFITHNTKGVGINRNIALLNSVDDILVFADDDIKYCEGAFEEIQTAFKKYPDADGFVFNVNTIGQDMGRRENKKIKRVRTFNFLNYGAVRLVIKKESLKKNAIYFSEMFGGGAKYGSGEDTLFIRECLKNNLKLYTYPFILADVYQEKSSWFEGYNDKYFYDKGALMKACFRMTYPMLIVVYALKSAKCTDKNFWNILQVMNNGARDFKICRRGEFLK